MANELTTEKKMTTKEVANALGVSYDTANNAVKRLFPEIVKNGKTTFLNEMQVAAISKDIANNTDVQKQINNNGKFMTIRNIADKLDISYSAVYRAVEKHFPEKMKNGKQTLLTEAEVAVISKELKSDYHTAQMTFSAGEKVKNAVTAMELQQNFYQAAQAYAKYLEAEKARLEAENERLLAKNESLEFALEYDKAKDCVSWGEWKKQNKIKASFEQIAKELNLEEGEDYFRQVLANGSRFPTIRVKESCLQSIFENYSEK